MTKPTERRHPWWPWAALLAGCVLALAAVVVVTGRYDWLLSVFGISDDAESAGADRGIVLSEVSQNPDAMWNREVVISADVERVFSPHAMVIGNDEAFVGDEVLVVSASPLHELAGERLEEGLVVGVRGVVSKADPAQLEQQVGAQLDEATSAYEGRAVLVVDRVVVDPDDSDLMALPGDTEARKRSAGFDVDTLISEVINNTERYLGERVTVSGEVELVYDQHAFLVGDAKVLVVRSATEPEMFIEPTVYVTGTVRRLDRGALERELGITLPDDLGGRDEVIVADDVALVR